MEKNLPTPRGSRNLVNLDDIENAIIIDGDAIDDEQAKARAQTDNGVNARNITPPNQSTRRGKRAGKNRGQQPPTGNGGGNIPPQQPADNPASINDEVAAPASIWPVVILVIVALLLVSFALKDTIGFGSTSVKADSDRFMFSTERDFNETGIPQKWIDFDRFMVTGNFDSRGVEIPRGDSNVAGCEGAALTRAWANKPSLAGDHTAQGTIDGVAGIVCDQGPNGRNLILGTSAARRALQDHRQLLATLGTACPTGLTGGKLCALAPVGAWLTLPNTNPAGCLRAQGTDPNGSAWSVELNIGKAGYPSNNQWLTHLEWMNLTVPVLEKRAKELRFTSNTGRPAPVIYEYRDNPNGCFI